LSSHEFVQFLHEYLLSLGSITSSVRSRNITNSGLHGGIFALFKTKDISIELIRLNISIIIFLFLLTLDDEVTVLTDDSDSLDSDPGEWLLFLLRIFFGRPFHLGARTNDKMI
jgi:hypothetical protein